MEKANTLNQAQEKAANHREGPLLIMAGAGTGKTKTIAERVLNLVKSGVEPENILAITFTNKAAEEMRNRVRFLLKKNHHGDFGDREPFISTFHSLGIHIIKGDAAKLKLKKHFSIWDDQDSLAAIKESLREINLDPKQFDPNRIRNMISRHKGDLITVEDYTLSAEDYFPKIVSQVWQGYERALIRERALDFDDLILKAVKLLENNPEILERYRKKFCFIHVDEYQDTNTSQYALTKILSGGHKNICVVGDSDQNIYGWRGANLRNILNFEKDYPGATIILLEENYRSTKTILSAANSIIQKNTVRKDKNLFTQNDIGEKISLFAAFDEGDEARFVATRAWELIQGNTPAEEIAILYRANFQSRVLEEAFLNLGIPHQVLGTRFFERKEVRDLISYLRASLNEDSMSDLKRVFNIPPRGIGPATIAKIFAGKERELSPAMQEKIADFRKILSEIKKAIKEKKLSSAIRFAIKKTGLEKMLANGGDDDKERLENLQELVSLSAKYDSLSGEEGVEKLLEEVALVSDQDDLTREKKPGVKLMTVHAAKGLEFKTVFVVGMENELFPHRRFNSENMSKEDAEEERRLFYVALTRAKEKLYLTFAETRMIFGARQINSPSEFLGDIDHSLVKFEERETPNQTVYI